MESMGRASGNGIFVHGDLGDRNLTYTPAHLEDDFLPVTVKGVVAWAVVVYRARQDGNGSPGSTRPAWLWC